MGVFDYLTIISGAIVSITAIVAAIRGVAKFIININEKNKSIETINEDVEQREKNTQDIVQMEKQLTNVEQSLVEINKHLEFLQQERNARFDKIEHLMDLQRDLLINDARYVLESTMRASIAAGYAPIDEKMNIGDLFAAYESAGGNHGVADLFHSSYKKLPTSLDNK